MTESPPPDRTPTEISLHSKSRLLRIRFSDGKHFDLPYEYLRVFSPAKEVRTLGTPPTGKENVGIEHLEPQGQYAVRIVFDDGHDTGIYSWDTLYELGRDKERNWSGYLENLEEIGYTRGEPDSGTKRISVFYFAYLVKKLHRESEELDLPEKVTDVQTLIEWLIRRRPGIAPLLAPGQVRVTVNRQFAEPFTRLENGDEVAFVPTSPTAPPTPDLF